MKKGILALLLLHLITVNLVPVVKEAFGESL
jgi:hypothetical protein